MSNAKPKSKIDEAVASKIREDLTTGVGYGRPPEHSRFKKGKSGNPAGRHRAESSKPSDLNDLLLAEARRSIKVIENGTTLEITAKEALIKASFKSALRGNSYAQERLLTRIAKADKELAAQIERENEAAEIYVAAKRAAIAEARAAGKPEPEIYPHPDDIVFEPGKPWRLDGPATKEDAVEYQQLARARDLFYLQAFLAPLPEKNKLSMDLYSATFINERLPPRMRLDDNGWFQLHWSLRRLPRREFTKHIQLGWRELGVNLPRGAKLPHIDVDEIVRLIKERLAAKAPAEK